MDMQFGFIDDKIDLGLLIESRATIYPFDKLCNITSFTRMKHGLSTVTESETYDGSDVSSGIKTIRTWLQSQNYVAFNFCGDAVAWRYNNVGYIDAVVAFKALPGNALRITVCGDQHEIDKIIDWMNCQFPTGGSKIHTVYRIDGLGNPVENTTLVNKDEAELAKDSFYPWMSIALEDYFKAFMTSNESVLLLYGPPGSGKSTFIRSLIHSNMYSAMMVYGHDAITSAAVVDRFHNSDIDILCYEDIDNYLGDREKGENRTMTILLNAAEGVVKKKGKKIVLSTNLPSVDGIDPALLRIGRCFDIISFRELTAPEASVVLADMSLPAKDFSSRQHWVLSDVLASETVGRQTINRFAKKGYFGI